MASRRTPQHEGYMHSEPLGHEARDAWLNAWWKVSPGTFRTYRRRNNENGLEMSHDLNEQAIRSGPARKLKAKILKQFLK